MTRDDLGALKRSIFDELNRMKREQENQSAVSEEIRIKDCSTCAHKGERNGACRTCVTSHNSVTQKNSTPSHWKAKGD